MWLLCKPWFACICTVWTETNQIQKGYKENFSTMIRTKGNKLCYRALRKTHTFAQVIALIYVSFRIDWKVLLIEFKVFTAQHLVSPVHILYFWMLVWIHSWILILKSMFIILGLIFIVSTLCFKCFMNLVFQVSSIYVKTTYCK